MLRCRPIRGGTVQTLALLSYPTARINTRCCFALPHLDCSECAQKNAEHDEEKNDPPVAPSVGRSGPLLAG